MKNKKTFWMNVTLSILFGLSCLIFFFLNIDYVEARPSEKILNLLSFIAPVFTAITFYKGSLQKVSLLLNMLVIAGLSLFVLRALYRYPDYGIISELIWAVPYLINVKYLSKIIKNKRYEQLKRDA